MIKKRYHASGFTMLEVLLVIGLLVALMALVVPNLIGRSEAAKVKTTKLQIHSIEQALEFFRGDMGRYPSTDEGLQSLSDKNQIQDDELVKKWTSPYLDKKGIPRDSWGSPLNYECPGRHNETRFDLWSNGPEKQEGTDDDITNWSEEP